MTFEYRPGDDAPRGNRGDGKSGAAPYEDLGPAPSRCTRCGHGIGVRKIKRGAWVEFLCRRCINEDATKGADDTQPASAIEPEREVKSEIEPETNPEPEPNPEPQTRVTVTFFENRAATTKREETCTLAALAERIRAATASSKEFLRWVKMARYGEQRTEDGCLRNNDNVDAITGIEGDYDGEKVTFDEAVEILGKAGVRAIIYTSPSHSADKPRWRVLCPVSVELPPDRREHLMGRINGLLRGIFSGESWTLSQAYFYGSVNHNPDQRVEVIDGTPIDLLDELDEVWTGKPATSAREGAKASHAAGQSIRMNWREKSAAVKLSHCDHASARRLGAARQASVGSETRS